MTDHHNAERRRFMRNVTLIATTAIAGGATRAFAATEMLSEDDPIAVSLGYKADATQVDIEKRPDASNGHGIGWTRSGDLGAPRGRLNGRP